MDRGHVLWNKRFNVHKNGPDGFLRFFRETEKRVLLEGSTHLIYQREVFDHLRPLSRAKFLFVLRNPALRVFSSYNFSKNNLAVFKKALDFPRFADLLLNGPESAFDEYLYPGPSLQVLKKDLEYSRYDRFLEKWLEVLGHDRLLVLQYEELTAHPLEQVSAILEWMGFDSGLAGAIRFDVRNQSKEIRNLRVHRMTKEIKKIIPAKKVFAPLRRWYYLWQEGDRPAGFSAAERAALEQLADFLTPSIQALEKNFGINSKKWRIDD